MSRGNHNRVRVPRARCSISCWTQPLPTGGPQESAELARARSQIAACTSPARRMLDRRHRHRSLLGRIRGLPVRRDLPVQALRVAFAVLITGGWRCPMVPEFRGHLRLPGDRERNRCHHRELFEFKRPGAARRPCFAAGWRRTRAMRWFASRTSSTPQQQLERRPGIDACRAWAHRPWRVSGRPAIRSPGIGERRADALWMRTSAAGSLDAVRIVWYSGQARLRRRRTPRIGAGELGGSAARRRFPRAALHLPAERSAWP